MIRIQLDWPQQEPLNYLFSCLHWCFALGAIFGLAIITAERSRINQARSFVIANLIGFTAAIATFIMLYLFDGVDASGSRYEVMSSLAEARVSVAIFISLVIFIIFASHSNEGSDFTASLFMTQKAFFISIVYGIVIMLGASAVARAVQSLLYHAMSSKVYMYIGTISGFVTYTIFLGLFPDFRKGKSSEYREIAQRQPHFIKILFSYILVPIVLVLTIVLLLWSAKTVISGMEVPFVRLSIIAASYTIGGLWLHAMVEEHTTVMSKIYRRAYPIASLIILVFEAWALVKQLKYSGLKTDEYIFILMWILAAAGTLIILFQKSKAHRKIAVLTCILAVISVLPVISYQALPSSAQVRRLEGLLSGQNMLNDNVLTPATSEPEESVRIAITDAVAFISNTENAKLPIWFDKGLNESSTFEARLGFKPAWEKPSESNEIMPQESYGVFLYLPSEAINISDYDWIISPQNNYKKTQDEVTVDGEKGVYHIFWTTDINTGKPSLKISLNDRVIIENSLNDYIDSLVQQYPPSQPEPREAAIEDMSLRFETPEIDALLLFNYIEISVDTNNDVISYWLDLEGLYIKENP